MNIHKFIICLMGGGDFDVSDEVRPVPERKGTYPSGATWLPGSPAWESVSGRLTAENPRPRGVLILNWIDAS